MAISRVNYNRPLVCWEWKRRANCELCFLLFSSNILRFLYHQDETAPTTPVKVRVYLTLFGFFLMFFVKTQNELIMGTRIQIILLLHIVNKHPGGGSETVRVCAERNIKNDPPTWVLNPFYTHFYRFLKWNKKTLGKRITWFYWISYISVTREWQKRGFNHFSGTK